ncbi:hypothetical protein AA309_15965 [Microvirga vignae]|uniref:Effector protein NopP n=1 Tax=Microvirga vignae TaxID=1225564 RepID=A0A0H1RAF1_9HYPH|nr:hypothetical protein [Microvirga vignae]KLK92183.1 hypothetical protein AA309_15965 [Microvirga vignae]
MYGRIGGFSGEWTRNGVADETNSWTADSERTQSFSDTLANMHLATADSNARSSSPAPAYSLVPKPPVVEISRSLFEEKMMSFYGDEIEHIAANPKQYSDAVSLKATHTKDVAYHHGVGSGSETARYFSYQLGKQSVGLLRTEGRASMSEVFEENKWRQQFPGRTEITSIVDLRVTHPLVENAGDILLEYQLRLDGERPLLLSHPVNQEAKARAAMMGFVEVSDSVMVLDPTQHPDKWTKNSAGEWQRANKPPLYLSKAEDSESCETEGTESAANGPSHSDDDDFM